MIDFNTYKRNIEEKIKNYIESSSKKILIFGEKLNIENKNIKVFYFNDINLNLDKNIFEQIIIYHELEKIINPKMFLLRLRQNLAKNSNILFVVYNISHFLNILNIFNDKSKDALSKNYCNHFNYFSLKNIINDTGFEVISEEIYVYFHNKKDIEHLIKIIKHPYVVAYSFIIKAKKIEKFPFIESVWHWD
ncbi:MAG: hypothetical protein KatS3mg068_1682 [Candidatus Sericytochromatia bacterium]|nr:MAG: hypothetical protein KatS3mg068_1682 [Candidatus Sericytochromatia bacterium]